MSNRRIDFCIGLSIQSYEVGIHVLDWGNAARIYFGEGNILAWINDDEGTEADLRAARGKTIVDVIFHGSAKRRGLPKAQWHGQCGAAVLLDDGTTFNVLAFGGATPKTAHPDRMAKRFHVSWPPGALLATD